MNSKFEISAIIKKRTLGLCFVLGAASLAFAQQKTMISGDVSGVQNGKISYASINFTNNANKINSDAVLTGDVGKYSIELAPGQYTVTIEAIDFQKYTSELTVTTNPEVKNWVINAESSATNSSTTDIESVTIVAQVAKPYRVELDKKIYDPSTDVLSKGGNLQDVLSNVPSISVDTDGTVSMRGNSNIKFLINGKPSAMLGIDEGADALKTIPADQIERIEVITNPSSKYEASGTAGILNIILKKSKKLGFNGSVVGSIGYLPQTNLNTNLSWKKGAWTYFINGGGGYSRNLSTNKEVYRSLLDVNNLGNGGTFIRTLNGENKNEGNNYNVNSGFVVDVTDKASLNASVMFRTFENETDNKTDIFESVKDDRFSNVLLDRNTIQTETGTRENNSFQADLGYDQKIGDNGQLFSLSGSYQNSKSDNNSVLSENTFTTTETQKNSRNDIFSISDNSTYLGKADYELPLGETSKIDAGVRYDYTDNSYNYAVDESIDNAPATSLENFTSNTSYTEKIAAAYLQFKSKIGKLGYQFGARVEDTNINIDYFNIGLNERVQVTKKYTGFFPSAFFSYEFEDKSQILVNFSRRIQRPRSFFLVPFNSYSTRSLFVGNPDLNPEYENSFELGYSISKAKVTFNPTFYYKKSEDETNFYQFSEIDSDNITRIVTQPVNAGSEQRYGLDLNGSYDPYKWLRIAGNVDLYGYKTEGSFLDADFSGEGFSSRVRLTATVKPDKDTSFQVQGFYRGAENNASTDRNSLYVLNFGASRNILGGDGTLAFNIQDLLNTRAREFTFTGPDFSRYSINQNQPRQFSVSLTYRFKQGDKVDQPKKKKDVNSNFSGEDDSPM